MSQGARSTGPGAAASASRALFERSNLTTAQYLIWMGQQFRPDDPLYNMTLSFRIEGHLDGERFRRAMQSVVDGSESLRSVYRDDDAVPRREVLDELDAAVELLDFSDRVDPEADYAQWAEERSRHCFALDGRLFDSVLVTVGPDLHYWFLNQHHLITDGWSCEVVAQAVAQAYEFDAPGPFAFPAFHKHLEAERAFLGTKPWTRAVEHWQERAAEPPEPTRFYGRTNRGASTRTRRLRVDLGVDRTRRLRELSTEKEFAALTSGLSLFFVFASAMLAFLHKAGGRERPAFLAPTHNRASADAKATPGLFIEIFPLQCPVDESETFRSLVSKVQMEARTFLLNARLGTSHAVHSRPWDVVLNFITASFGDFGDRPLQPEWLHPGHGDPAHAMRLQVHDFGRDGSLTLLFDLNEEIFDPQLQRRASEEFVTLLDAMTADLDLALSAIDVGAPDEDAIEAKSPRVTVVDSIWARASRHPEQTALRCEGRIRSYGEVVEAAESLAVGLRERGVGPGSRIGILLPRSFELVTALLGVLRVGATYVPLDPTHPAPRWKSILEDAGVALTICDDGGAAALDSRATATVDSLSIEGDPGPVPSTNESAYVLYTSGSTGKPKGVEVEHVALSNYVHWAAEQYVGAASKTFAFYSSIGFDLTVTSVFVPLVSGGRIQIYPEAQGSGALTILRVWEEDAVDVLKLTPAHLSLLREVDRLPTRVKTLILGGEDLKVGLAREVVAQLGDDVTIYNEYGPTEATVGCMIHRYDPKADQEGSVPIGEAIDGLHVELLAADGHPVGAGASGEIYVSGAGLARGYLGRPELTEESFPFVGGTRWYRTGDLGRRLPTGQLVYAGRVDDQVKIRGARIEPGEIEAALLSHPSIQSVAITTVEPLTERRSTEEFCAKCGLSSRHPDAHMGEDGICALCNEFTAQQEQALAYFRSMDDLQAILDEARARKTGEYDCVMLLSGGKDSSYALFRLAEMGAKILAFTLDNGFISEGAKENVRRATDQLGVELVEGRPEAMAEIFRDSLDRFSNVCQGCFKTIYTLGTNLAHERGIPLVVTGLSRGQIYETRIADLFHNRIEDPDEIDAAVIEARKAYHRMDDAVSENLDVSLFESDEVFEEVKFADFYRYCDVPLEEMYRFLETRAPWVRPSDTGRSTNCLINEAGIWVHKKERGFHNYALPYSWDVRLGHKVRDEALAELNDELDPATVREKLQQVGYDERNKLEQSRARRLAAYYVADRTLSFASLREYVAERLPEVMIPSHFVRLDALPLTPNGKVDKKALPAPDRARASQTAPSRPLTPREAELAAIWTEVMGLESIGPDDDFFEMGGDSILAIQIVARARREGLGLQAGDIFRMSTLAELAEHLGPGEDPASLETTRETSDSKWLERLPTHARDGAETAYPLSPIQEGMLFHALERPEDRVYHEQYTCILEGEVDAGRLKEAWATTLQRHATLRTRFVWEGLEAPLQVVESRFTPTWRELDWSSRDEATQRCELESLLEADRKEGFDLREVPIRFHLIGISPSRKRIVWSYSHLLSDGWSLPQILGDVARAYAGQLSARDAPLPYRDYVEWIARQDLDAAERFWRAELAGFERLTTMRLPKPTRAAAETHGRLDVSLDDGLTASLQEFARAQRVTVNTVALAAWALLLSRYSDSDDVVMGATVSGRPVELEGVERAVGAFLNTVPLRARTGEGHTVGAWLRSIQAHLADVRRFEWTPLRSVQEWSEVRSGQPLFESLVVLQNLSLESASVEGLSWRAEQIEYFAHNNYPLGIIVEPAEALRVYMVYRADRFDAVQVEQMAAHYEQLLHSLSRDAHQNLDTLNLGEPSMAGATLAPPPLWLETFEATVDRNPQALAVGHTGEAWSYAQLDEFANRIAHQLQQRGAGPGRNVAFCLERSPEMIGTLLGILKSGAAYVPLDPAWPEDRLRAIAAECEPVCVVTRSERPLGEAPQLRLDTMRDEHASASALRPMSKPGPEDLAYVLYTSGSTGTPHGVMITHAHLAHSTAARDEVYENAPTGFLLLSSPAFDSSVAGIFWTLGAGGTLWVPPAEKVLDLGHLRGLLRDQKISHLLAIPSLYRELLAHDTEALASLEVAIVAGETCPPSLVHEHRDALSPCALFNEYGPTEATVWCSVFDARESFEGAVPIGRAVPGLALQVMDSRGRPVPRGVSGELWVSGPQLAVGYWKDDPLTQDRFVKDVRQVRWYRTGDLVRRIQDDRLAFLGRMDHQVKIRGQRIELGEIETVMRSQVGVQDVAVLARESTGGARIGDLAEALASLPASEAEALLAEVEGETDSAVGWSRQGDGYRFRLDFTRDDFLHPPRDLQRQWLVHQTLDDLAADLSHLDEVAQEFVPGAERAREREGFQYEEYTPEEIMEDWQIPLMQAMARHAAATHGDVLEIGFGRGVSAEFLQREGLRSHTVVEADAGVIERYFHPWRAQHADAEIHLLAGRWQDVEMKDYDAVFFHAVPLDEKDFLEHMAQGVTFAEHFFPTAAKHLRPGGVFTYLSTEIDSLSRRHQRALLKHFASFSVSVVELEIPPDTRDAWWANRMAVVQAVAK